MERRGELEQYRGQYVGIVDGKFVGAREDPAKFVAWMKLIYDESKVRLCIKVPEVGGSEQQEDLEHRLE